MTIVLIEVNPFEDMPAGRFLEIAASTDPDRKGLTKPHGGVASNGYRMHLCKDVDGECNCGDEKTHKTLNDAIDKVYAESKFVFAISKPMLLEALAGISEGEHAGEIYFYSAGLTNPVAIASKGCTRAALIMPVAGMEDNPLLVPRIREPISDKNSKTCTRCTKEIQENHWYEWTERDGYFHHSCDYPDQPKDEE